MLFSALNEQIKTQSKDNPNFKNNDMERFFINIKEIEDLILKLQKHIKVIHEKVQFYSDNNLSEEIVENLENVALFLSDILAKNSNKLFWMEKSKSIHHFHIMKMLLFITLRICHIQLMKEKLLLKRV